MAAARRSGNYEPSLWDDDYLQSITSVYAGKAHLERAERLKEEVKLLLVEKTRHPRLDQLQLVDDLERLGISYHFTDYIDGILERVYRENIEDEDQQKLHATALRFRLLRRYGYFVPQEVFTSFMDEAGNFKNCLRNDVKGLLSLYEASHLSMEDESALDCARAFACGHLKENLKHLVNNNSNNYDEILAKEIVQSLELPLHRRMQRLEARRFIEIYEKRHDMVPVLLQFAKLDFNIAQAMYHDEVKQLSRWYTNSQLAEKLSFARDRLVESFLWTIGFTFEPRFRYCRIMSAKLVILITIIDDMYDVYGTVDELQLFTHAVKRWDINELEQLPDYMRICFLALFNAMNELAYDVLKIQGFNGISHLKRMWAELCEAYSVEARWISAGHTPSLKEFLDNALISITGPLSLGHLYFCITNPIEEDALEGLMQLPDLIRFASLIARMTDDLGTSPDEMKKGDVAKSIQCYMHETGCSEEEARDYVKDLVGVMWKKVNKEALSNKIYAKDFIEAIKSYVRIHQCM